jgi:hypothetical protein
MTAATAKATFFNYLTPENDAWLVSKYHANPGFAWIDGCGARDV